jgi:hypothetical protein
MGKAKRKRDPEREHRIRMEIIVDANGPEEQAMGWYYYLSLGEGAFGKRRPRAAQMLPSEQPARG